MAEARAVVGDKPTYVSFDIDCLDPAYAPGTGTPEVGGFTTREAQFMLRGLRGLNLCGADVVEVSPPFDPSGYTALAGVTMMFELSVRDGGGAGAGQMRRRKTAFVSVDGPWRPGARRTRLAVPKDLAGAPMAAVRALIRAGVRDLHLITVPTNGWATDWLVGAGAVAAGRDLRRVARRVRRRAALQRRGQGGRDHGQGRHLPGDLRGLQAGEKGLPFMPLRGVIGSDVLAHRDDWKVIDNPFAEAAAIRCCCCRRSGRSSPVPRPARRPARQCLCRDPAASCRSWRMPPSARWSRSRRSSTTI